MPIDVNWFNEQQTGVLMNFEGYWTWDLFYKAIDEAMTLFNAAPHPAALIIDLTRSEAMPIGSISQIRNAQGIRHPQIACVIFVGMNTFMQMIGNLSSRLSRSKKYKVYIVATMDDAKPHIPMLDEQFK